MWLIERGNPEPGDVNFSDHYYPGIFQAFFWCASAMVGQFRGYPGHIIARLIAFFWALLCLIFISFFTAYVTSALTVQNIKGDISGPSDLAGKKVSTVKNSTAVASLLKLGAEVIESDTIDDAVAVVIRGKAAAVVYDAPVLQYLSSHDFKGKLTVVGNTFMNQNYGIAFPIGSPLRKTIDEQLLALHEDGTYQELTTKWFGQSQ
jgi:polar amino acid transport system substrate-binding protein